MKSRIKYILLCAVLFVAGGCDITNLSETNILNSDISLSRRGNVLLQYDSNSWQCAFNSERNEYRCGDDVMNVYFVLRCSERPVAVGQTFSADLIYRLSSDEVKEKGLDFEVQKLDSDGLIWLWNRSRQYGVVIRDIE